jgi:ankyrin repeat protein
MKKDEIWKQIKEDETEVYGQSMLDMFLMTTDNIKKSHYDELPESKKKITAPEVRLKNADSVAEAEKAIKTGAKNFNGALEAAASRGLKELVKFLVDDKRATGIYDAFCKASGNGHLEVVKFLADRGVSNMDMALKYAAGQGHLDVVQFLFGKGAKKLQEALWDSVWNNHLEVVKFLKSQGVDDRWTLPFAAELGHLDLVKFLSDGSSEKDLNNALVEASHQGHLKVVEFLVDKGAKSLDESLSGAIRQGHKQVVDFLKSKGAK